MQVHKDDGTVVTIAANGDITLEASTTYHLSFAMDSGRGLSSIHLKGVSALILTSVTLYDSNLLDVAPWPVGASSGDWIDEDPTTAFVGVTGNFAVNANGIVSKTAGAAGGAMFHLGDFGSARGRLTVVVGGTGGVLRVVENRKA